MEAIKVYPMKNSAILRINSEKDYIDIDPVYQRQGGVWTLEKKQLLIDSILNEFDIPKLYFHILSNDKEKEYAVIDGRQRLEAIWGFVNDEFSLSTDFMYYADSGVEAKGLKYSELAKNYPRLKIHFDSFSLPIICVETDDLDLIEDMFSRLNEAVPLNAAEKRNAMGGPMAKCIREIAQHPFFKKKVRFSNGRYQHREVAARLLFIEYSLKFRNKIIDTKKSYLDNMVRKYRKNEATDLPEIKKSVKGILDKLSYVFQDNDTLLRAQSVVPVYYLTMKAAINKQELNKVSRSKILEFIRVVDKNRRKAEEDISEADYDLLEYDRLSQQGTNDAVSIEERSFILKNHLRIGNFIDFLSKLTKNQVDDVLDDIIGIEIFNIIGTEVISDEMPESIIKNYSLDYTINDYDIDYDEDLVDLTLEFHLSGEKEGSTSKEKIEIYGTSDVFIDSIKNVTFDVQEVNRKVE